MDFECVNAGGNRRFVLHPSKQDKKTAPNYVLQRKKGTRPEEKTTKKEHLAFNTKSEHLLLIELIMETLKEHKRRRTAKKQKRIAAEKEEDDRLTALLFGNGEARQRPQEIPQSKLAGDSLFVIDRQGETLDLTTKEPENARDLEVDIDEDAEGKDGPVWQDDDDDIQIHLKNRLAKLRHNRQEGTVSTQQLEGRLRTYYQQSLTAQTNWANLPEENDQVEEEHAVVNTDEPMLSQGGLKPTILATVRCPDANMADPNQAAVQAVHFHPGSDPDRPLLLTAGLDKTLRFFQVGEEKSEKIHGIHCKS